jgi:hypothetical protein
MDVSGGILRTRMPAVHAGTTRSSSYFVSEQKLKKHFVYIPAGGFGMIAPQLPRVD